MKIGIFDSGIGGITVLRELRARFPGASYIYFGDTANVPYGTKSPQQVEKLSIACAQQLKALGVDLVVVACNTASSLAMPAIQTVLNGIPAFGMVEPGVRKIWEELEEDQQNVLILGTRATIRSHAYRRLLNSDSKARGREIRFLEQACPLLVPMIEEGWTNHPLMQATLQEYVGPYRDLEPGVALLACTHYPWIHEAFEKALPGWRVLNSATAVADHLIQSGAIMSSISQGQNKSVHWVFTDAVPQFAKDLLSAI